MILLFWQSTGGGGGSRTYTQTFSVLGPHGYPRPPYGSFAGKPIGSPRVFSFVYSVLGPHGYSRPPLNNAAKRTPVTFLSPGGYPSHSKG